MRHISIRAVILGAAITFLLDLLVGSALLFAFGRDAFAAATTDAERSAVISALTQDNAFLLVGFVLGTLTTVTGGFVAGLMARRLPYMNSAAVGAIGVLQGLMLFDGNSPYWFSVLGFVINIPAALVGGHLAKRRLDAGR
jgi:hypothetical protein